MLVYHFAAQPFRSRSRLETPHHVVATYSSTTTGTIDGRSITPTMLGVAATGAQPELVAGGGYRTVLFLVPPDQVEPYVQFRDAGPHFLEGQAASVTGLHRWGRSVLRAAEQGPRLFDESRHVRDGVRREMIERLGDTLASTREFHLRDAEITKVNHSRLVRKVQDYALETIDRRIHLKDLCDAARVSERALRYAFQDVLGMSPVAYLSRLRLHRVHNSLKHATPGTTTVTEEAFSWGFWHAGEFSKAYKECFEESPSDTLSREP